MNQELQDQLDAIADLAGGGEEEDGGDDTDDDAEDVDQD